MEATKEQKTAADEINGIVVQHLEDDEIRVAERFELDVPAQAQRLLYVSPGLDDSGG